MKILLICHFGFYTTLEDALVYHQAKEYAAAGHQVRIIVPTPIGKICEGRRFSAPPMQTDSHGIEIMFLRHFSLSNFGKRTGINVLLAKIALLFQRGALLDGFQPDVIQAHTFGVDSEVGAVLKNYLHCPLVVTTHGGDTTVPFDTGRIAYLRRSADKADAVIAVSGALQRRLEQCGTYARLGTILNGSRLSAPEVPPQKTSGRLIQVSHLNFQKRVHLTIEAFARLKPSHPDITLTLVGQGPEREALKQRCEALGIQNAVTFKGQIPNRQVLEELSDCEIFCMPSVREGFGIVYLEAMANGCVTIGTEGEGIADLIVHGENGFLVPPDNVDAIVEVMDWCLSHPEEAAAIAERGRRDALTLTWEKNAALYLELFESLISN